MATASTPTNFVINQGNSQVYVAWDLMSGATSYGVTRGTDGVNFATLASPSVNYYLDTSVTSGTQYYYQVASINGSGTSGYSSSLNIVPAPTAQMSLGQIRLLSQQRADRVNSKFITDAEWNQYINQSYFELYDLLVSLYEDYFLASPVSAVTDGTAQIALPNGSNYSSAPSFYKLMGLDCCLNATANAWVTLRKFNFGDRNKFVFPNITSTPLGIFNMQYRVMGSNIQMIPTPSAGQTIRIWYIPRLTQLLQDSDIADGVSGWTEYMICDAAIKALQKEESDVSVLMAEKQALIARIQGSGMNRDAGEPSTISNSRSFSERWGGLGGDPGGGPWGGV